MATVVNFNNKQIIEPGAYSRIKSGIPTPPVLGTYGNVMIIDTGSGKDFGFGSGINGELANNANAIYEFNSSLDMKRSVGGGILWDIADYLWSPTKNGNGPNKVFYTRGATTISAKKTLAFTAGSVTIACKNEGTRGNGAIITNVNSISIVSRGYACQLKAGLVDTSAFILEFYEGQYRGLNDANQPFEAEENQLSNYILCKSSEFTTVNQLISWMNNDSVFNQYFTLTASTASAVTLISSNLTTISGYQLFTGGTTVYNSTDVDAVLSNIEDLDNSLFLCDDYGINPNPVWTTPQIQAGVNKGALSTANQKILGYIRNNSTATQKIMFVGGGNNSNEFNRVATSDGSLQIAKFYNDALAVVVHSGIKMPNTVSGNGLSYKALSSFYHTALVCGLVAGLEPQIPCTYKNIRISGLIHELKKTERELALQSGVLHTRYQNQLGWVINQGINTLQQNGSLISQNGESFEIQIMRIIHQINKELVTNATIRFVGGNLFTASAEEIKAFVEGYLQERSVRRLQDNLIIRYENVTVKLVQDYWWVEYCFVPNGPINKLFFTGFIIDPKIQL